MFRNNLENTGYSTSSAPAISNIAWTYTTCDSVDSSPAVANGKIYIGSDDNKVYCLDAEDGSKIWSYTTDGEVVSSPAVTEGKVYIGSEDNMLYCLDAEDGSELWSYDMGWSWHNSPVVSDGRVYKGSSDGSVFCLDAEDGAKIWGGQTIMLGSATGCPAVANGKIYIGSGDYNLYCLDAEDGNVIWMYYTGNSIESSPAIANGKVYIGSYDNKVYCLDAEDGDEIWSYETGGIIICSPAVANGKIYIGSDDNKVYCLDAEDGDEIWSYTTENLVRSSPAIANGKVYIGACDGNLYCLDADDGSKIWDYNIGWNIYSSPAVANGKIYIGSDDNKVYCFGAEGSVQQSTVEVTYPNGGETIEAGSHLTIKWNSRGISSTVDIYLLYSGNTRKLIADQVANDGEYSYTILDEQTPNEFYKINIVDGNDEYISDYSDDYFTILAPTPSIEVTLPNSGEKWHITSSETMEWYSEHVGDFVDIYIVSSDSSDLIARKTENDGSYTWNIPKYQEVGLNYKINVQEYNNPSIYGVSDGYFSIDYISELAVIIDAPARCLKGEFINACVHVVDDNGNPIDNAEVRVDVDGLAYVNGDYQGVTNSDGNIWFEITSHTEEQISISAIVSKDGYESAVEAKTQSVYFESSFMEKNMLFVIGLILLIIIITIFVLKRNVISINNKKDKQHNVEKTIKQNEKPQKKHCPNCGNPIESDWQACPHCGNNIEK